MIQCLNLPIIVHYYGAYHSSPNCVSNTFSFCKETLFLLTKKNLSSGHSSLPLMSLLYNTEYTTFKYQAVSFFLVLFCLDLTFLTVLFPKTKSRTSPMLFLLLMEVIGLWMRFIPIIVMKPVVNIKNRLFFTREVISTVV